MRAGFFCAAAIAGLVAAASPPQPASAQELNQVVRTLNAVLNPQDALRLEERARHEGRAEEERYWRDYRAGLEHRPAAREDRHEPRYGEDERRHRTVDSEEARRLDEQARRFEERSRRNHRVEEERYWRDYRAGLEDRARE